MNYTRQKCRFFYGLHMDNDLIQQVLSKTLEPNMTPAKIKAYADVIRALKNTNPPPEPNAVKEDKNDEDLSEDKPLNFSEITGLQVDNGPREKVNIHA